MRQESIGNPSIAERRNNRKSNNTPRLGSDWSYHDDPTVGALDLRVVLLAVREATHAAVRLVGWKRGKRGGGCQHKM